jgi:hypothetical protein
MARIATSDNRGLLEELQQLGIVAGHLAAAHRESDQRDVAQLERRDQRAQVAGEGVVVVARRRLAGFGSAFPAPSCCS